MKPTVRMVHLVLSVGLSLIGISAAAGDSGQEPPPDEWTVPDCNRVTGTHCVGYTPNEGLDIIRLPRMKVTQYCRGLAVLDQPNTLLATNLKAHMDSTVVLLSENAGCSWTEIAMLNVTARLYVTAAPGGGAYLWTHGRDSLFWYDGSSLSLRFAPDSIFGLAVDPEDPMHIRIGGSSCQIYESVDGGEQFAPVGQPSDWTNTIYTVAFDPNDWDNALCGGVGASGTHDAGATWTAVQPFDPDNNDRVFSFAYSTGGPSRIYARGTIDNFLNDFRYIWMSTDGGNNFVPVVEENQMVPDQDGILRKVLLANWLAMAVHPDSSQIMYFIYGRYMDEYGTDFYRYNAQEDLLTVTHTDSLDEITCMAFHPLDPSIIYLGLEETKFPYPHVASDESSDTDLAVTVSPNPFNPTAEIRFSLAKPARVKLEVFNIAGQKVGTLADGHLSAGDHAYTWDGSKFASGVYLYRLQTGQQVITEKMMLLK
ncbi:MAG: T9SS type A sorting domain-containing protein [Candidatus Zixiibacteriota bacterium]|nr:MAG: T9SS type A sorting domain-containing protein [candidate division Zixibacteria bacterium]